MVDLNDEQVQRAVSGDTDALTELLMAFAPAVERSLNVGSPWRSMLEPADVMQVTYLEAYLQIGSCAAETLVSFEAWLRRIAQNNLQDAIRGLQRMKRPQPSQRIVSGPGGDSVAGIMELFGVTTTTPSRCMAREELLQQLSLAIESLPTDYAQALKLYDFEGRPIAEVAARMNRSAGAVHMLRARALDRLRELLGPAIDSLSRLP